MPHKNPLKLKWTHYPASGLLNSSWESRVKSTGDLIRIVKMSEHDYNWFIFYRNGMYEGGSGRSLYRAKRMVEERELARVKSNGSVK